MFFPCHVWSFHAKCINYGETFHEVMSAYYIICMPIVNTVKPVQKRPLSKRPKIGFQYQLSHNTGQKYCRMLQGEHSAILLTFIKLPFVIKVFVLSIFEWPFYTGYTVNLSLGLLTR